MLAGELAASNAMPEPVLLLSICGVSIACDVVKLLGNDALTCPPRPEMLRKRSPAMPRRCSPVR